MLRYPGRLEISRPCVAEVGVTRRSCHPTRHVFRDLPDVFPVHAAGAVAVFGLTARDKTSRQLAVFIDQRVRIERLTWIPAARDFEVSRAEGFAYKDKGWKADS